MNADEGYLILFGIGLGIISFLLWMLFGIGNSTEEKEKPRGICPLCKQHLMKGERIRSDQVEIGDVEVQTKIKGCPYCMGMGRRPRNCPICKKKVGKDEVIIALSDPRVDRHKLKIMGCKNCWPQGF